MWEISRRILLMALGFLTLSWQETSTLAMTCLEDPILGATSSMKPTAPSRQTLFAVSPFCDS